MAKGTLLDAIITLKQQGHKVTYIKRKDGGYVVTSVDGIRFNQHDRQGNAFVRELTGKNLTESFQRRLSQQAERRRVDPLPPEVKKALRRTQRAWLKGKREGGKYTGDITTKTTRRRLKYEGIEATLKVLEKNIRYSQGYAYEENVDLLINRIRDYIMKTIVDDGEAYSKWERLVNFIESIKGEFREEWIEPVNAFVYGEEAKAMPLGKRFNGIASIVGYGERWTTIWK